MIDQIWFDRQSNPITLEEWGQLRERGLDSDGHYGVNSYVRIGEDVVRGVTISTVWLGLDHGFSEDLPVIFETMIFGGEHDNAQMRYCTEEEAIHGHQETVADVTAGMAPFWSVDGVGGDEVWADAWVMRVNRIMDEMEKP